MTLSASAEAASSNVKLGLDDYNFAEGDEIDLTALFTAALGGANPDTDQISDFVQIVDNGAGAVDSLQVDADGGGDSFTTIATLDSSAGVRVVIDDSGTPTDVVV